MIKFILLNVLLQSTRGALLYAERGQNVTVPCFFTSVDRQLSWYRQIGGEPPQIISSYYKPLPGSNKFVGKFKDDSRLTVQTGEGFYHLSISNVQQSDSAMYFCAQTSVTVTEFDSGIFLVLKDSNRKSYILQPASDSARPGGSVTLECAVHQGVCGRGLDVYWFKKDSGPGGSPSGIMYVSQHNNSQRGPDVEYEPAEQRCVYSLSKRNLTESDAGTYYCAVAHCGHVLFGTGTRLEVGGKVDILLFCVAAALLASVLLNIVVICILCKMSKGKRLHSGEPQTRPSDPVFTDDSQNMDLDSLQYVALDFKKGQNKSRRQRSREEPIYSGVRQST